MNGVHCALEPLSAERHAKPLFEAYAEYPDDAHWTYLPYGPFETVDAFAAWVAPKEQSFDPIPYAILAGDPQVPVGVAAYLRVNPEHGSVEVGHVHYAPALRRTRAATEAMYLMMRHAFDELGYRRYEWKCHALNAASRAAAERLGFRYEGTFRNAMVMKGGNRDTAWFSITVEEWPAVSAALSSWLRPENFDADGRQLRSLPDFRE